MQKQLFLKQKDYEMINFKSTLNFTQSISDPLINLKQRKGKAIKTKILDGENANKKVKQNPLAIANPLFTNTKKQIQQTKQHQGQNKNQQYIKLETPWTKILASFVKSYDIVKQSMDLQVANPFGSYGTKVEEQVKGLSVRQSKISTRQSKLKIQDKEKQQQTTISIKTYLKVIELMKRELQTKWAAEDKVACLQIAIQACKLLHDSSNAKFQALKFAYVIQIIERFGILVFERIKKLSFPHLSQEKLAQINIKSLSEANIPESAQQIARNWLLKIASIRQLIPRTVIEITLLRLQFFISNGVNAVKTMQRLSKSNRCFGQYINCIFICTFLVRMGKEALPLDKNYILNILEDVFFYIKHGKNKFQRQDATYDECFLILQPFFITSFQCFSQSLEKQKFKKFFSILPQNSNFLIIKNLILRFSPSLIVLYSTDIVRMIQKNPQDQKYQLYRILLQQLRGSVFNQSGQFIVLLWTDISQLNSFQVLLDLLGPFSEIIFRNLPKYQKNKFYSLILQKFNSLFANVRGLSKKKIQNFERFLTQIIIRTQDVKDIVSLQPFLQLIAYFPQKSKQELSYSIIKVFANRSQQQIKDLVVVHIMLSLIKNLSGFKINGKKQQIQSLVLKFIDQIDFTHDWEQFLNFYSHIRANFGYFQKVTVSLIYKAAGLTYRARKVAKGKITNKLVAFLQAAVAFCYITVPVIQRQQIKLKLYLYLSEVALSNNLISQGTSLIKTSITQLSQAELKSDTQIYGIFFRIISFMIVIPDDPQKDFLHLFSGLFQAFEVSKFKSSLESMIRFQFYTNCITYLSCQAQQKLPFHLQGVTSNDGLFKSKQFKSALVQKIYEIFDKIQKLNLEKLTNEQSDLYLVMNLPECVMKLIDIFQDSQRVKNLFSKIVKLISSTRDRVVRKQNPENVIRIKRQMQGLNSKLKENQYTFKVI